MPKQILVVEDDQAIRELIQLILTEEGFDVSLNADGLNVLKAVEENKPDLVLLDVRLPFGDGREICKEIKKHKEELPVILMSAHAKHSSVMVDEACADDFIPKPFDIFEFVSRIERHFDN